MEDKFIDVIGAELKEIILSELHQMQPRYREVLMMFFYEEMSYKEIAEELGRTELGTRILLHRAKRGLRKRIEKVFRGKEEKNI